MKLLDWLEALEVLAVLGLAYFIYRKVLAPAASVVPSAAQVKQGVKDIAVGLPGYIADKVAGRDESGYMTDAQQRANAAANLAAHRAALGAA